MNRKIGLSSLYGTALPKRKENAALAREGKLVYTRAIPLVRIKEILSLRGGLSHDGR